MVNDCRRAKKLIPVHVAGTLGDGSDLLFLLRHLDRCAECIWVLADRERISGKLDAVRTYTDALTCVECGEKFQGKLGWKTCSEDCRLEYNRRKNREYVQRKRSDGRRSNRGSAPEKHAWRQYGRE